MVKVSVLIITYNQASTIKECMDSVLVQRTDFDFEIVVADDASTDDTPTIVSAYAAAHPDRVRAFRRPANLGPNANLLSGYRDCSGEYIALCEGDDYWLSPAKLDSQVAFMDRNPDCSLCFHPVIQVSDRMDEWPGIFPAAAPARATLTDLLEVNFIPTCSVMYRRIADLAPPAWYERLPLGDWPLHVIHAQRGWIGKLDGVMAAYRATGGVWSSRSRERQIRDTLVVLDHMVNLLGADDVVHLERTRSRLEAELSSHAA